MKYKYRKRFRFLLCGCFPWLHSRLVKTNARFAGQKWQRRTWESCWAERCDL